MPVTAKDYRLDWILREGDTIQTADAVYTITGEPIGLGGSSILYPASKSGSHLDYAIKECFPANPAAYQRTNGIVRTMDPTDELNQNKLTGFREIISKEKELGQKIRNTTMRAVSVWDELLPVSITTGGETFHEVFDGGFSVLERVDKKGRFFNELLGDIRNTCPPEERRTTFGLPSIQLTVQIMEQALRALKQVHDAGYYFGDLSGSNLLLTECDLEKRHVGIGHLIDFGSTRKLEADGYTAPIINEPVFSTDGFKPFEIRDYKDNELRLGKQADVYSAGCLFLHCVLSPAKIKTLGDSPSAGSNILTEANGKSIGCSGRALQLVNEILDKATQYNPDDRYADASEMLDAILNVKTELLKFKKPHFRPKALRPILLASGNRYLERTDLMEQLDISFSKFKLVFLSGLSGSGKSELARRYANKRPFDVVHTLSLNNDGTGDYEDLRKQLVADGSLSNDIVERNRELDELLGCSNEETLIVLDNYNSANNSSIILDLMQRSGSAKILVTTQLSEFALDTFSQGVVINLQQDDNSFAASVFLRYANLEDISDALLQLVKEIVSTLGNHTMMAAIMGSQVRYYPDQNRLDELLQDLRECISDVLHYSPSINITKDFSSFCGDPHSLLKKIFQNTIHRNITPLERQVISTVLLLPEAWRTKSVICRVNGDLSNRRAKCFRAKIALNKLVEDNLISLRGEKVEVHPLLHQLYIDPDILPGNQSILIQDSSFREHLSKNIFVEDIDFFKNIYNSDDDWLYYVYEGIKSVWADYPNDLPSWITLLIKSPLSTRIEFNQFDLDDGFLYPYKTLTKYIDDCVGSNWSDQKIGGIYFSMVQGTEGKGLYATILSEKGALYHEYVVDCGQQLCPQKRYLESCMQTPKEIYQFSEACTLSSFVFWIGIKMPILSHVNDIPVTTIGKGAYRMNGRTTGTIPATVKVIGSHAFSKSPNIRFINEVNSLQKIGYRAFFFCWDLEEVTLSPQTVEIEDLAFAMCRKLRIVNIPYGLKKIGDAAFMGCDNLSQITIPSSVTEVGTEAHKSLMDEMGLSSSVFYSCNRDFCIITKAGSYAEQYAENHKLKCILDSDVP